MNRFSMNRPVAISLAGLFLLASCLIAPARVWAESSILELTGPTMGTRYMVKVFDPPQFESDIRLEVDALLRRINDLMSTYLESSELSRFNRSTSTDWFEVDAETANVVAFAQSVAEKTGGAFDVTVGPLVNAWSFGPDPRTKTVPDPERLEQLRRVVGFEKLSVRTDPPALRKSTPELQVDLSAIAKGYAVDRVVQLLNDSGAPDVFVEIGGEVRTSGDKDGQWWKVGIQVPDLANEAVLIAHSLNTGAGNDQSMATSGDYRNFFEVDGVRYSHTIDPRTARPIEHALASVSVVAESCMEADAWATALNVVGPDEGQRLAEAEGLSALLIRRGAERFELVGTGSLERYSSAAGKLGEAVPNVEPEAGIQSLVVPVITALAFGLILSAMAIGVMFGRRSISGSCGGLGNVRNEDGSVSCSLCSNPADACKELRERMAGSAESAGEHVRGA